MFREDAQEQSDKILRIETATSYPRFTFKMAVKTVYECGC